MQKTPDEIKKGLECCIDGFSCRPTCPYTKPFFNIEKCTQELATDALDYIQHKEQENAKQAETIERLNDGCHKLIVKIQQLEAERDAAVADISKGCFSCKHGAKELFEEPCNSCRRAGGDTELWQWRGVQKEE